MEKLSTAELSQLIGQRFGRWIVLSAPIKQKGFYFYPCRCDCGQLKNVRRPGLLKGTSKSCGCLKLEMATARTIKRNTKHGAAKTPEYEIWKTMKQRCLNPKNKNYSHYGGRGIAVCDRWLESFENFFEDMGAKPSPKHSIDRRDNEKGYSPDNCYWATKQDQANNMRSCLKLEHEGNLYSLAGLCRLLGLSRESFKHHLKDMKRSVPEAIARAKKT